MSAIEDMTLLGEIAAFAAQTFAEPIGQDSIERREHLTFLQEKFDEAAAASGYPFIMQRRAPMVLTAVRGVLDARKRGDHELAADCDRIIGVLVPGLRQDAQALLARAKEA